jgi:hypothetical protein
MIELSLGVILAAKVLVQGALLGPAASFKLVSSSSDSKGGGVN